jgi:hypothetical protein
VPLKVDDKVLNKNASRENINDEIGQDEILRENPS